MSPTIREAQNAGAFLLAVCAIFVPYFPAIREHYIIFYYIIICKKTTLCQIPASPPNEKQVELPVQLVFLCRQCWNFARQKPCRCSATRTPVPGLTLRFKMQAFPLRYYANYVCYKSRISTKKRNSEGCSFFYSEVGISHDFIVPLLKRQDAAGKTVVLGRFFVAGNPNYN